MPSEGDEQAKGRMSRRNFVKSAGALVAAGAVGGAAASILGQGSAGTTGQAGSKGKSLMYDASSPRPGLGGTTRTVQDSFSIFWMTDTQFLSEENPALFRMMTNWVVRNWEQYNGRLVVHTGDFVQNGMDNSEWDNADEAMSTLLKNRIPYVWCAGNHDNYVLNDPASGWIGSQRAPSLVPSNVSGMTKGLDYASWVGDYHEGMNTAVSFSATGLSFLVIGVEWNAQPDVLAWMESILNDPQYSDHHVIVAPHAYVDSTGSLHNSDWAAQLDAFVNGLTPLLDRHSSRVFLTLNGHFPSDCGYNSPSMTNNRNMLMFDRQDCSDTRGVLLGRGVSDTPSLNSRKVGGSTITVLTFTPVVNQIGVRTFDVYKDAWRNGPSERYAVKMFATSPGQTTAPIPLYAEHI